MTLCVHVHRGTLGGGLYGVKTGLSSVPNSRFKVKVNALLNHGGRGASRAGNAIGCVAMLYSLTEGLLDKSDIEDYSPVNSPALNPALASFLAGLAYKSTAGPRVAALAGCIGAGTVAGTYGITTLTGMKFANTNFMFF